MNRGTNEHIRNSIWERKINTVCTHHNIDINHLHTLEKQQQRAEFKKRMQTSRTQMLLRGCMAITTFFFNNQICENLL